MVFLDKTVSYQLYSATGILITQGIDSEINIEHLHNGVYFIKTEHQTTRIIKMNE
jgi:hypothetical protein